VVYEGGSHVHRLTLAPGERRLGLIRIETSGAGFLGLDLHDCAPPPAPSEPWCSTSPSSASTTPTTS
jgi:hypothetical protein